VRDDICTQLGQKIFIFLPRNRNDGDTGTDRHLHGQTAFVMSLNWETKNFTETRDYAVVTKHGHEVGEIIECFKFAETHGPDAEAWRKILGQIQFIDSDLAA
jgi:hypothetical protein